MIDGNDPAFPAPEAAQKHFGDPSVYPGMTLRDYFAAQVIGHLAAGDAGSYYDNAVDAYKIADAMLSARKVKK